MAAKSVDSVTFDDVLLHLRSTRLNAARFFMVLMHCSAGSDLVVSQEPGQLIMLSFPNAAPAGEDD